MAKEPLRPDIQAVVDRMPTKIGAGRELRKLPEHLAHGEQIDKLATGTYGKGNGLLVLTDRRLLFVNEGITSQTSEDLPFGRMSSIQWSAGMIFGSIIVHASGQKIKIDNVEKAVGRSIADAVRDKIAEGGAPATASEAAPPVAPPNSSGEIFAQIERLGELRDKGLVSSEEFEVKKAELLSRL